MGNYQQVTRLLVNPLAFNSDVIREMREKQNPPEGNKHDFFQEFECVADRLGR
jgi:hypothetical protein